MQTKYKPALVLDDRMFIDCLETDFTSSRPGPGPGGPAETETAPLFPRLFPGYPSTQTDPV